MKSTMYKNRKPADILKNMCLVEPIVKGKGGEYEFYSDGYRAFGMLDTHVLNVPWAREFNFNSVYSRYIEYSNKKPVTIPDKTEVANWAFENDVPLESVCVKIKEELGVRVKWLYEALDYVDKDWNNCVVELSEYYVWVRSKCSNSKIAMICCCSNKDVREDFYDHPFKIRRKHTLKEFDDYIPKPFYTHKTSKQILAPINKRGMKFSYEKEGMFMYTDWKSMYFTNECMYDIDKHICVNETSAYNTYIKWLEKKTVPCDSLSVDGILNVLNANVVSRDYKLDQLLIRIGVYENYTYYANAKRLLEAVDFVTNGEGKANTSIGLSGEYPLYLRVLDKHNEKNVIICMSKCSRVLNDMVRLSEAK